MCQKSFTFLCCGLIFLIISSSKSQKNSTDNDEKDDNSTIQNEEDTDSKIIYSGEIKTIRYDLCENKSANNVQYIHNPENDDQILINSHTNSTNVNHKGNFTSQKNYENLIVKNNSVSNGVCENFKGSKQINIVPYEMCHNITCILLCCPLGNSLRWNDDKCIPKEIKYHLPNVYESTNDLMENENKKVNELFYFAVHDSCLEEIRFREYTGYQYDYKIFTNGSIYIPHFKTLFKSTSYCLAVLELRNKIEVTYCSETYNQVYRNMIKTVPLVGFRVHLNKIYLSINLVHLLFLVPIFLVYSILPELRNVHGFILCNYSFASSVAIIFQAVIYILYNRAEMPHPVCITLAFFNYFWSISSYFWLSIMSFNIWRTFRGFCSLQKNFNRQRQSKKKMLLYYVIFAYGCSFILGIIFVIVVDFVSKYIPKKVRPGFEIGNCWYRGKLQELYSFWVKTACIISSICLSISAVLNIKRFEKSTDFRLTDSESNRYNDNKKWFNLYMKLFIVIFIIMGLNWSVFTMSWLFGELNNYYFIYVLFDIVQSFCIFVIFVWKKKIKLMLLKRFGYETNAISTDIDLNNTYVESIHEQSNSCGEESCHAKISSKEIDT